MNSKVMKINPGLTEINVPYLYRLPTLLEMMGGVRKESWFEGSPAVDLRHERVDLVIIAKYEGVYGRLGYCGSHEYWLFSEIPHNGSTFVAQRCAIGTEPHLEICR